MNKDATYFARKAANSASMASVHLQQALRDLGEYDTAEGALLSIGGLLKQAEGKLEALLENEGARL